MKGNGTLILLTIASTSFVACAERPSGALELTRTSGTQGELGELEKGSPQYEEALALNKLVEQSRNKGKTDKVARLALWSSDYKSSYANAKGENAEGTDLESAYSQAQADKNKTYTTIKIDWQSLADAPINVLDYEVDVPDLPQNLSREDLLSGNDESAVDFWGRLTTCKASWVRSSGDKQEVLSTITVTRSKLVKDGQYQPQEHTLAILNASKISSQDQFFSWVNKNLGIHCVAEQSDAERERRTSYIASLNVVIADETTPTMTSKNTFMSSSETRAPLHHLIELEGAKAIELRSAIQKSSPKPTI